MNKQTTITVVPPTGFVSCNPNKGIYCSYPCGCYIDSDSADADPSTYNRQCGMPDDPFITCNTDADCGAGSFCYITNFYGTPYACAVGAGCVQSTPS